MSEKSSSNELVCLCGYRVRWKNKLPGQKYPPLCPNCGKTNKQNRLLAKKNRYKQNRKITISFSRKEVEELGIVACKCGHRKNNHFTFGKKHCAHCACEHYEEIILVGKVVR